ncbi:MAG: SPOR domain-containing protein [Undibacterium sp.]|nr:SPOR domain-containing protein [Undibacterium sp.]
MSLDTLFKQNKQKPNRASNHASAADLDGEDSGEFRSHAEEESIAAAGERMTKSPKRSSNARKATDESIELPEKKRARRRLIGAIALVLAAVIGLPMLFDAEPKATLPKIAIEIPSKDLPISSNPSTGSELTSKPNTTGQTNPSSVAAGIDATEQVVSASVASTTSVVKSPESASKATSVSAVAGQDKAVEKTKQDALKKPELKPDVKVDTKVDTKPETKPEGKLDTKLEAEKQSKEEAARALALLEGRTLPEAKSKSEGAGFVVQVAALNSPVKIRELQDKLKAANVASYTQKVITKTGEVSRIRVGPFANKAEAEKVHAKLVKLGLGGSVIPR